MSTFVAIETISSNLILSNLHSSADYYISVVVCNSIDCGPSSSAVHIKTPLLSKKISLFYCLTYFGFHYIDHSKAFIEIGNGIMGQFV